MKIYNEQGFLTKEGEEATKQFKAEIRKLLTSVPVEAAQTVECILKKIVGDTVCDFVQEKKTIVTNFNSMSDEEFDKYLAAKYTPLYGETWFLFAPLTVEETARFSESCKRKLEKVDMSQYQPKHPPFRRLSRNYGVPANRWRIRNTPYDAGRGPAFPSKYRK